MGWAGDFCNETTSRSIYNSVIFGCATVVGIILTCYRLPVMFALIKSRLLKFNPSGITTILAWSALMIQIISGAIFIASFYFPGYKLQSTAFGIQCKFISILYHPTFESIIVALFQLGNFCLDMLHNLMLILLL